ncbi:uridine diphosphate glucose pyrophosphatase NUDT14-like [Dermatophagoides pteronyssinus]|uniref:uridine diphosphate glucose pyrophosphatase NUDT14-like n=1 Tax=Dermatophagoides pteronyssinus TaxID=6956 RepID=UPI003F67A287
MSDKNIDKESKSKKNSLEIIDIQLLQNLESQYLKPFRLQYRDHDGRIKLWDCIQTHDSVSIIIFNISRNVLVFVRQFRPPVFLSTLFNKFNCSLLDINELRIKAKEMNLDCGYTLELCAGIIDKKGLSPKEIAREEILEETGYNPPINSLEFITSFRTGVGTSGSLQHLFYCQVDDSMRLNSGGGIDDESIEVIELSIESAKAEMYANDEETGLGRTSGFRFAVCWFNFVKYPQILTSMENK